MALRARTCRETTSMPSFGSWPCRRRLGRVVVFLAVSSSSEEEEEEEEEEEGCEAVSHSRGPMPSPLDVLGSCRMRGRISSGAVLCGVLAGV
jgi:hypothetical protein